MVCALGLQDQLVGITHECDYPPSVVSLPRVTRTVIPHDAGSAEIDGLVRERLKTSIALYTLDMSLLEELKPDLLITQALCDVCAVAEAEVQEASCRLPGNPRVLNLEPMSLEDVFQTMAMVGEATGMSGKARAVIEDLRTRVQAISDRTAMIADRDRPRVAFLEWIDPLFCGGHWNPRLIELAGGVSVLGDRDQPSRTTAWDELAEAKPDVVFIACCGFSLGRTLEDVPTLLAHPLWETLPSTITDRVYVTDGNAYFSRPGPRLVDSLEILAHALHPTIHPLPAGLPAAARIPAIA